MTAAAPQVSWFLRLAPFGLALLFAVNAVQLSLQRTAEPEPDRKSAGAQPDEPSRKIVRYEARLEGQAFGTQWRVRVLSPRALDGNTLKSEVVAEFVRLDAAFSSYRPDSALMRFNATPSTEWQAVPAETAEIAAAGVKIGRASGGALDITAGPLLDLWGIHPRRERATEPTEAEVAAARERMGLEKIAVRLDPPALKKTHPQLTLNVSALGEGYAIDRIAALLNTRGFRDWWVELGGEMRARGLNPAARPWRAGIEEAAVPPQRLFAVVQLDDAALSSSGVYAQGVAVGGRRIPHVLDPRSARPPAHGLKAVSVKHRSALEADGWATALLVLGPVEGRRIAAEQGLEVWWQE